MTFRFIPFSWTALPSEPELNQPDQLHPLPEGVAVIVERILPTVTRWLDASGGA